jgi:putative membrane protein
MLATMATIAAAPGPWEHGPRGGGLWWIFPIFWGLFWITVIVGGFTLLRRRTAPRDPLADARTLLAERFARGEIDENEYYERLAALRH